MAPALRELPSPLAIHPLAMEFFSASGIPAWQGFFAVYTDNSLLPSVKKLIEQTFKPHVDGLHIIEENKIRHPEEATFLKMVTGTPGDAALPLMYFRAPNLLAPDVPFSPEKDGAGILWFAPLIPAKKESVQQYLLLAIDILKKYGFEPAFSFTSLSDRCFDSVLAILFNSHNEKEILSAKKCYEELFVCCKEKGFVPYRIPHSFEHLIKDTRIKTETELMKVFARNKDHTIL